MPNFFSGGPTITPLKFFSTTNPVIPFFVRAKTEKTSAMPAFVIQTFVPFKIHLSPTSLADVLRLNESDPASGSVKAKAAIFSPEVN